MSVVALKQKVAEIALSAIKPRLQPNTTLGIGTGTTVDFFIDCLAKQRLKFANTVSSSVQSTDRLKTYNIDVVPIEDVSAVDVYVDGADEVDPTCALVKGGGGALTREKIVASISHLFVCIVDESKIVDTLGRFPVPVEVLPFACRAVTTKLRQLGGQPKQREGLTENGNCILDVCGLEIRDPNYWEQTINDLPGVVTTGIFSQHKPHELFIARADGSVEHRICT